MRSLAFALCASLACQAPPPRPPPAPVEIEAVAKGSNALAFDLYARMRARKGNVVFSPFSISMGLAALWPGARGGTAAQIQQVLHAGGKADRTAWVAGHLVRRLMTPGRDLTLSFANRLYVDETSRPEPAYAELTETAWGAPLELVDFRRGAEASRRINGWVAEATRGRIREVIPPGGVGGDARLVLANATDFLGKWEHPFREDATRPAPFHLTSASEKDVPMMRQEEYFRFASIDGLKVLGLRYQGTDIELTLLLPDGIDGLDAVERRLSPEALERWRTALHGRKVAVWLPSFELHPAALSLRGTLSELGMPLAFDRVAADFGAVARPRRANDGLFLADVFHLAFVKVDERGTEAAAATVVLMAPKDADPRRPVEFRADHPFLFLLHDAASGAILFMGRVSDPRPEIPARASGAPEVGASR